CARKEDSLDVW
nr:immunoglobulin heavy chain junction region [Macaca mulatta]MOV37874.1 immunoglobulin heavy chain junction region [Macaca mulatta]MOV38025.1 immunoglobulin heavy chain junction region [Macaca mulatta]MOV38182.1 immunoglobulin heavy chain junction region [Macaca mulatta]MOV38206.1 immunoglobulin heavy chain junction region [Macaca mulatta]